MWQAIINFFKQLFSKKSQSTIEPVVTQQEEIKNIEIEATPLVPGSLEYYQQLWLSAKINPSYDKSIQYTADKIILFKDRYLFVQKETGIPWQMIGCIHNLEASFNFKTCLHNGDPLGYKTVHVPIGRGPFFTWEQAAIDALKMHNTDTIKDWKISQALKFCERYNGLGYMNKHPEVKSPYIWSGTTHYSKGKYVADGKFDSEAVSKQIGVAAALLKMKQNKTLEIPE